MAKIRAAGPGDEAAIRAVLVAGFPTPAEADLVERLGRDGDVVASLVAEVDEGIAGLALLSPVRATGEGRSFRAVALGPVAVLPEWQRRGIGSALVRSAIAAAELEGAELAFVLGDPALYTRFGFSLATAAPFASPYAGPHFMAIAFAVSPPTAGAADYAPAFGSLG